MEDKIKIDMDFEDAKIADESNDN